MATCIEFKTVPFANLLSGQNQSKLSLKDCQLKLKTITRNTYTAEGREKIRHLNLALDTTERLLRQLTPPSTPEQDTDEATFVVLLDNETSPAERRFLMALKGLDTALHGVIRDHRFKTMDQEAFQVVWKQTIGTARHLAESIHKQRDGKLLADFPASLEKRKLDVADNA